MLSAQEFETVYLEEEGRVVIELEDGAGGLWEATDALPGAIGGSFLQWTGGQRFAVQTDEEIQPVTFKFRINRAGTYRMQLRSRQYDTAATFDAGNDSYFRFASGTTPDGFEDISRLTKFWVQDRQNWSWVTTAEPRHGVFFRDVRRTFEAGDHSIQIDGRSPRHAIDRLVLYHVPTVNFSARTFDNFAPSTKLQIEIPAVDPQKINLGKDEDTPPFAADQSSASAETTMTTSRLVDTAGVVQPAPAEVYQTAIEAPRFRRELTGLEPNKYYLLRLHFTEVSITGPGQRVIDVTVNRTLPASFRSIDIFQETGGAFKALVRQALVKSSSAGSLSVTFRGSTGNAVASGLELVDPLDGPTVDEDQDGLPDDWELTHLGRLTASDGSLDSDGDGVADRMEYLVGQSPTQASSSPLSTLHTEGDSFEFVYQEAVRATGELIVQQSSVLLADSWEDVPQQVSKVTTAMNAEVNQVSMLFPYETPSRFYRLREPGN